VFQEVGEEEVLEVLKKRTLYIIIVGKMLQAMRAIVDQSYGPLLQPPHLLKPKFQEEPIKYIHLDQTVLLLIWGILIIIPLFLRLVMILPEFLILINADAV
tara:strand:+ start:3947 stop:4249 length:303 start_codon:yes stop_codon:yes gene_type:complete